MENGGTLLSFQGEKKEAKKASLGGKIKAFFFLTSPP